MKLLRSRTVRTPQILALLLLPVLAAAADWPMMGGAPSRNMVSTETGLPTDLDPTTSTALQWTAKLGSSAYGTPVVAQGKVLVGTNNANRDPRYSGERGTLLCFDEATGAFCWQLSLPGGSGNHGLCSTSAIDGDRVYMVTHTNVVMCLDLKGMANGNDGPVTDEERFTRVKPVVSATSTDADIIWSYDLGANLKANIHDAVGSSVLVIGDRLYVGTSNAFSSDSAAPASRQCPVFIALDKKTGALLGVERSGISKRILHGSWSSVAYGEVNGKGQIFYAVAGTCYGFDATPVPDTDGTPVFKELWSFDCNTPETRPPGNKQKQMDNIGTPVYVNGLVYLATGEDPTHGPGPGNICCIDPTGTGDITKTGAVWTFAGLKRSDATLAVAGGLVYASDVSGNVYCLDAKTGKQYWTARPSSEFWSSPLVADGKVYFADKNGRVFIYVAATDMKQLAQVKLPASICVTPVAANGTLYIATFTNLYAFRTPAPTPPAVLPG
jgi:outer membrane protein assembly factor BamB